VAKARLLLAQRLLHLSALLGEHAAQPRRRNFVLKQRADLIERQAELLQRQDAVQPRQLADAVKAVARRAVGVRRLKEAELIIEAELPARHLSNLREFANAEHGLILLLRAEIVRQSKRRRPTDFCFDLGF
jgi:hypothetical protein